MSKEKIPELFSLIAKYYDFLNHLLSLNLDRGWRRALVGCANLQPGDRILDVCTGTGDIAIELAQKNYAGEIVGVDLSEEMLRIGQQKIETMKLDEKIKLLKGDCLSLPFENDAFDVVTIAFGLRNLLDYKRGIAELVRVLRSGGRLLILEFSLPENALLLGPYRFYLKKFVPLIGGMFSGSSSAYEYLSASIQSFLSREEVIELMKGSRLKNLYFKELTGGIASIYRGEK